MYSLTKDTLASFLNYQIISTVSWPNISAIWTKKTAAPKPKTVPFYGFYRKAFIAPLQFKHRFPFLFLAADCTRTAPYTLPLSVFSLKSANRIVQSSLPFSVRIFYREPYHSKKRTVFLFFTKIANRTDPKIINFSVFTINKNGKLTIFRYGTVRD